MWDLASQPSASLEEQPMFVESDGGGQAVWHARSRLAKGAAVLLTLTACAGADALRQRLPTTTLSTMPVPANKDLKSAMLQKWEGKQIQVHDFSLTNGMYTDAVDHASACVGEFGDNYSVADWDTDLGSLSKDGVLALMSRLNISATFNEKHYFVQEAGWQYWGGSRAFFFERHDGKPPSNWAVHDQLDHVITLGSWLGISGQVLCVRKPPVAVDENTTDVCGQIPADRVFDVQWSGDEHLTTQNCYGFAPPYDPHKGRIELDREGDYFSLVRKPGGAYSLRMYHHNGTLAATLPDGKVTLASPEMVFYIIDGWFGTVITSAPHKDGDSAVFGGLTDNPDPQVVSQYCRAPKEAEATGNCLTICQAKAEGRRAECGPSFTACVSKCDMAHVTCSWHCTQAQTDCIDAGFGFFATCVQGCVPPLGR